MSEIGSVAEEAARTWGSLRPATINRRLCVLKAAAKHSWRSGVTSENRSGRGRLLRGEKCAPSEKRAAAAMLAAYTGLRAGELLAPTSSHISKGSLTVERSRAGKPRRVPITPVVSPYLSALPLGLSYWELHKGFVSARLKAKLPQVRFHDLRHTTASMLINAGVPLEVAGEILGHSSLQTTQRCAHLEQKTLRAGMRRLR